MTFNFIISKPLLCLKRKALAVEAVLVFAIVECVALILADMLGIGKHGRHL